MKLTKQKNCTVEMFFFCIYNQCLRLQVDSREEMRGEGDKGHDEGVLFQHNYTAVTC